jgi:hypothetical protein
MSSLLTVPLPSFDRKLLRVVEWVVPAAERADWARTWQAELWCVHHLGRRSSRQGLAMLADLSIGLTRDALWLRGESWRRALSGTPSLCLGSLLGLCVLALVIDLAFVGGWGVARKHLAEEFGRFLFAAPLVVFVGFATATRRYMESSGAGVRIRRQIFSMTKTELVLLLSFLVSVDACEPFHRAMPNTADVAQIFLFVIVALVGLRWAFRDQEQRCERCLCVLASPARVGRPTYNLLEWNGTEQVCKQGHGMLSVPEMESSWRQSSRWVERTPRWDDVASA